MRTTETSPDGRWRIESEEVDDGQVREQTITLTTRLIDALSGAVLSEHVWESFRSMDGNSDLGERLQLVPGRSDVVSLHRGVWGEAREGSGFTSLFSSEIVSIEALQQRAKTQSTPAK